MLINKIFLTSIFVFVLNTLMICQDVSFSQINNNKLYLNPAFTNSRIYPELTMSYRNQWPSLGSDFVTSMVTYEQSMFGQKNGFGLMLLNDRSINDPNIGPLSLNSINLYFSNQQKINRKLNVKFGFELSYRQKYIDHTKLNFPDTFDESSNTFTNPTSETFIYGPRVNSFDLGAGILFFGDKWFTGLAINHLNEPNESFVSGESILPMKYGLHGGVNIEINKSFYPKVKTLYMPSFSLLRQGEFTELTVNNNIKNGNFLFGVGFKLFEGYSHRNALITNFGVDTGRLVFCYAYDLTVSELGPNTGGSHEISTIIRINQKSNKKKPIVPSCTF